MERINRRNSKSKLPFIIAAIVFILGGWLVFKPDNSQDYFAGGEETAVYLEIGETRINLDIADTPQERNTGLSGKETLPEGRGMFFVFESPDFYQFWMKDVKFAIDIIWISQDWEIISIDQNVLPSSYPVLFKPAEPALYVLEVNSGFALKNQISVGDRVKLLDESLSR